MMPAGDEASTIACVSGFLFNMLDRSVRLVTPCCASDRWPLGYWVLDHGHFSSAAELRALLDGMIRRNARAGLGLGDRIRLRRGVTCTVEEGAVVLRSHWLRTTLHDHPEAEHLAAAINEGRYTAEEIALERESQFGIPMEETFLRLMHIFRKAWLDEEPEARFLPHATWEQSPA
jgi:hypothetical protein